MKTEDSQSYKLFVCAGAIISIIILFFVYGRYKSESILMTKIETLCTRDSIKRVWDYNTNRTISTCKNNLVISCSEDTGDQYCIISINGLDMKKLGGYPAKRVYNTIRNQINDKTSVITDNINVTEEEFEKALNSI